MSGGSVPLLRDVYFQRKGKEQEIETTAPGGLSRELVEMEVQAEKTQKRTRVAERIPPVTYIVLRIMNIL